MLSLVENLAYRSVQPSSAAAAEITPVVTTCCCMRRGKSWLVSQLVGRIVRFGLPFVDGTARAVKPSHCMSSSLAETSSLLGKLAVRIE